MICLKKKENFANISYKYSKLETSNNVIIPVPYDYTQTWRRGAKNGPKAFFLASKHIELYDIETNSEVYKKGIFVTPNIRFDSYSSIEMINRVYNTTKKFLSKKKFVILIGGEHSISIGSIRAFGDIYSNISILHLDAHADLRKEYNGNKYNHACSMHEVSNKYNLIQVGIRSIDKKEKKYIQSNNMFYMDYINSCKNDVWIKNISERLSNNVFISIDIDVLDPSIAPSTGTPEPGGFDWYTILKLLKKIFKNKNVIGFDIVELLPSKNDFCTDFLTVKLFYKLLSYKYFYL